jgi:hypothetical protein
LGFGVWMRIWCSWFRLHCSVLKSRTCLIWSLERLKDRDFSLFVIIEHAWASHQNWEKSVGHSLFMIILILQKSWQERIRRLIRLMQTCSLWHCKTHEPQEKSGGVFRAQEIQEMVPTPKSPCRTQQRLNSGGIWWWYFGFSPS